MLSKDCYLEKDLSPLKDRFKLAILPSVLLGVFTNVYIAGLILYADVPAVLISPITGSLIFVLVYFGIKRSLISTKLGFFIGVVVVMTEVCIHSVIFGWNTGFYFYLFLLPLVFLLESNWKIWTIVVFNVAIFGTIFGLNFFLSDSPPNDLLSHEELQFLAYLNGIVSCFSAVFMVVYNSRTLAKRDQLLLQIISDLEASNRKIAQQHDHQKILLKEIHHRVKNNLQIISSLLSLQSRTLDDEHVLGVLNESRNRVEAIALIHKKLYQDEQGGNAVDFNSYLEDFVEKEKMLNPKINFFLSAEELILHLDIAVPLGLIVSELITNSVKHAFQGVNEPKVALELIQLGDQFELWIRDNGVGLPEGFDIQNEGLGLGADIIVALSEQIDAELQYYNINGASCKIVFQNRALK